MSSKKDVLDAMKAQFQRRLADETKAVALKDHGFEGLDDVVWYFRPTTSQQGDAIMPHLQAGKLNAAVVEIIFQRAMDETGDRIFRTPADRLELLRVDPEQLSSIVAAINGFDDIQPNIEDARGNSKPTGTSATVSG